MALTSPISTNKVASATTGSWFSFWGSSKSSNAKPSVPPAATLPKEESKQHQQEIEKLTNGFENLSLASACVIGDDDKLADFAIRMCVTFKDKDMRRGLEDNILFGLEVALKNLSPSWKKEHRIRDLVASLRELIDRENVSKIVPLLVILKEKYGSFLSKMHEFAKMGYIGKYFCTGIGLGHGSFSDVFVGYHCESGEKVAIKILKDSRNLQNEINVMESIDSRRVVKLRAHENNGRDAVLVLEFCDGQTLQSFIKSNSNGISEAIAQVLLHELALGLRALWVHDICHRDLKPENIIVYSDDGLLPPRRIKLIDFGLARVTDSMMTSLVGTPYYMAPEVLQARELDSGYSDKSDLYSVGLILYEMLYGRLPFRALNQADLQREKLTGIQIPPKAIDLLRKLLCADPNQRISWQQFLHHPFLGKMPRDRIDVLYDEKQKISKELEDSKNELAAVRLEFSKKELELLLEKSELLERVNAAELAARKELELLRAELERSQTEVKQLRETPPKPTQWVCPACTLLNDLSTNNCNACDCAKPV